MKVVQIQFSPWDKIYNFSSNNLNLEAGDKVVVKTELGVELGEVVGFLPMDEEEYNNEIKKIRKKDGDKSSGRELAEKDPGDNTKAQAAPKELKPILRKASAIDLEKATSLADKKKALDYCKATKDKHNLLMKFIDVHYSFDSSRMTFAFISDGRVDFRELVKDLTRHFGRTIRLQQIGIRDEAKFMGDFGHCGKQLCCKRFLPELTSITSEMAEIQQCSHRGSERISGVCGRLMCCLSYEEAGYEDLAKNLPAIGTKVSVDGNKGVIVGHHTLKQSVDVEFPGENGGESTVLEVDLNRHKEK